METSQLICIANQLNAFYMMGKLVVNDYRDNKWIQSLIFSLYWYLCGDMTLFQTKVKEISAKHDAFSINYLGVTKYFSKVFRVVARTPRERLRW